VRTHTVAAAHVVPPAETVRVVRVEPSATPAPKRFDWIVAAYLAISGAFLLRLALGLAMSYRLLRHSRPTPERDVRESDRISSPVTLGVVRPVVVLPADWCEWSEAKLAAVLAHERSHIRRHDPAVQLLSAIHRALLWYGPLSWYLDRQIVRLAEQASDDAAIGAIDDRASYAGTLLEFMQRGVPREVWQGVPMARYGQPAHRIDRILDATSLSRGITRWTVAAILALGMPLAYVIAAAQERLAFDAASVKPTTMPDGVSLIPGSGIVTNAGQQYGNRGGPGTDDPGRIHYPVITLRMLLTRAYAAYFDVNSPDWADTDVVAVDATMPPTTTKEQFQKMLQSLLIDRFALKTHVETKEINGYALTVAPGGPKLKGAPPDNVPADSDYRDHKGPDGFPVLDPHMRGTAVMFAPGGQRARLVGPQASMAELASRLGDVLYTVVEDHTNLKAAYNIDLAYAGHWGGHRGTGATLSPPPPSADPSAPEPFPDIFSALQSQLGLKLDKQKVSVEILVVDHLEKAPVGN
jgi:uncharacterized protein (TIGR03435 family)